MYLKSFSGKAIVNSNAVTVIELIDRGEECPPGAINWRRYRIIARFGFHASITLYETPEEPVAMFYLSNLLEMLNGEETPDNDYEDDKYDEQLWSFPD